MSFVINKTLKLIDVGSFVYLKGQKEGEIDCTPFA